MTGTLFVLVKIACLAVAGFSTMMLCWMPGAGDRADCLRTLKLFAMGAGALGFGFMVYGGEL